jgi:hypothetical protein
VVIPATDAALRIKIDRDAAVALEAFVVGLPVEPAEANLLDDHPQLEIRERDIPGER